MAIQIRAVQVDAPQPDIRHQTSGGTVSTVIEPFTITLGSFIDGFAQIFIHPGSINNIIPTNMFGTFMYPEGTTANIVLQITTDGSDILSSTINASSPLPTPAESTLSAAPTYYEILLGSIINDVIYQVWAGNINAIPTQVLLEQKASPSPGESVYNRWWNWVNTVV